MNFPEPWEMVHDHLSRDLPHGSGVPEETWQ